MFVPYNLPQEKRGESFAETEGTSMRGVGICVMGTLGGLLLAGATVRTSQLRMDMVPSNLGNRTEILCQLEVLPTSSSLCFAVVGDSEGSGTFEQILRKLRNKKLDFIVHLGDFAAAPSGEGHAFFIDQVKKGLGPGGPPMLVVMGNHDVGPNFPVESFEALYGPSSFAFRWGENLFVVVSNCLPRSLRNGQARGKWREQVLSAIREKGHGVKRTFVFMHAPPVDPLEPIEPLKAERFQRRWDGLGINYFIAGHLHEYARTQIGATVVLVSGGGGGTLRRVESGTFYHALILRVAGDQVTEELLAVDKPWALLRRLERAAIRGLFPLLSLVGGHGTSRGAYMQREVGFGP